MIATVTVDTLSRLQVMTGWEARAFLDQTDPNYLLWRDKVLDMAVNDLGLNRLRLYVKNGAENPADSYAQMLAGQITEKEWRCRRYTTINDNNDPNVLAPAGFHYSELDETVERVVLPMKQRIEARGETLVINLNYVANINQCPTPLPAYAHASPPEYAEFILAMFLHLQQKYGLIPNIVEVILEPDNTGTSSPWTGQLVGQMIAATGPRLAAAGFHPKFAAPSTLSMTYAPIWFDRVIGVAGAKPFISEIAYHRYAGVSDGNLALLASRAKTHGITTAMLEKIGSDVEDLYKDIVLGGASAWQQYNIAGPPSTPVADPGGKHILIINNQPVLASRTRYLRQYFRYVRLGAQRVGASSDNTQVRPVGFVNTNGKAAVVIHTGVAGNVFVRGLRAGVYGTSVTTAGATGTELGDQVVGPAGTILIVVPAQSVLTVYRK